MFKPCEYLLDHPEILADMPVLYSTEKEEVADHVLRVRFYHPLARWSWYGVEYDQKERLFFGWVEGTVPEWGYFSLSEMAFTETLGVPVMWDKDFKPIRFGDLPRPSD